MTTRNKTGVLAAPGKQEVFVTREFEAARELVFRAHTEPRLFVRWFGCHEMTTVVDRFEARDGGTYRFTQQAPGYGEFVSRGVFHAVTPECIVKTIESEGRPGQVALETTRFESLAPGRTRVTVQTLCQSVAVRDAMLEAGVEHGASETFDRLDAVLADASLAQGASR